MKKQRVTLMYPNLKWADWMERTAWVMHPYNIGLLGAMIEDRCDLSFIDANFDNLGKEEFAKVLEKQKPNILGISLLTNEYTQAGFYAAEIAKNVNEEITTVFGGVPAISTPKKIIQDPNVDYVVNGEGEYIFRDLCDFLGGNGEIPKNGILFKQDGKIINTGRADFITDLNQLPYPVYHLMDFKKYTTHLMREDFGGPRAMPYTSINTSRGCPYGCSFCEVEHIFGKKPRLRSVEHLLGEIDMLVKDYGIKALLFQDDNMVVNKERAKRLFREMKEREYNIKWNVQALSLFNLDEELIDLMKDGGCVYVNAAVESGVQRVLDEIIHKPLKLEKARRMIDKIKSNDIDLCVNFVIGNPGETWQEIRETINFAEEIDVDSIKLFIATPLPNTKIYEIAKEKGYLVPGFHFDQHLWTDGWMQTPEFRPQDLKILRAYEWDRINFTNHAKRKKVADRMGISEERLDEIRKETLKRANP